MQYKHVNPKLHLKFRTLDSHPPTVEDFVLKKQILFWHLPLSDVVKLWNWVLCLPGSWKVIDSVCMCSCFWCTWLLCFSHKDPVCLGLYLLCIYLHFRPTLCFTLTRLRLLVFLRNVCLFFVASAPAAFFHCAFSNVSSSKCLSSLCGLCFWSPKGSKPWVEEETNLM